MAHKKQYLEKQKNQLTEWSSRIEQLKATARKKQVDASVKCENSFYDLQDRLDKIRGRLNEIQTSSEESWGHLRDGMENAWGDLKTAFDKARSRFK